MKTQLNTFLVVVFTLTVGLTGAGIAQQASFTIPLGKAIDEVGLGRFEMDPLFLGLDDINERLNVGTIVGSANATIIPEVRDPIFNEVLIPKVTGDTRTGARVTGTVQGRAGLELNAYFDLGGIGPDASFQYTPTLHPPATFYAGELVNLNPRNGLDQSRAFDHSNIQLPSTGVNLDVIFDIRAAGQVDYGVAGIVPYDSAPFDIPIKQPKNDDGTNFTLIGARVDLNNQEAFGELTVTGERISIDPGQNGTLFKHQIKMDPTPPPVNGEDPLFHRDIGEVAFVKPELGNTLLVDTTLANEQISYAIDSKIVRLGADIDGIASALAAGNSYTRFSKTLGDPDSDFNATLSGELVDLKYGPEIGYRYQSSVDTQFDVDVQFTRNGNPVSVGIVDENGTRVSDQLRGKWNQLPEIVVLGEEAIEAEVTFQNANFLLNEQGAITISDYLEFNALSFDANVNVGPLPVPVVSMGPVLHARTSVLEHIDFPDIPAAPQFGPDPLATIRTTRNALDAIGEIKIFENIGKELISIPFEEGNEPSKTFSISPKPSEIVFWRDRQGWERLSNGNSVTPSLQHKLIFGSALRAATVDSELDLGTWNTATYDELGEEEVEIVAQSIKILDGSTVKVPETSKWTTNRLENHGRVISDSTRSPLRLHAPNNLVLTIGGTGEIDFRNRPAEIKASTFLHEAEHTLTFGGAEFLNFSHALLINELINHGTINVEENIPGLTLSQGLTNSGLIHATDGLEIVTDRVDNTGIIRTDASIGGIGGFKGNIRVLPMTSQGLALAGNGEWIAGGPGQPDGPIGPMIGNITFAANTSIAAGADLSFVVDGGTMEFESKLNVFGNAEFVVEPQSVLRLNSLATNFGDGSRAAFVNRGTIEVRGSVKIGEDSSPDPTAPQIVPINLDNASGTVRIHPGGSLVLDAKITNYAQGGATFDVGTWILEGQPLRWDHNSDLPMPDGTQPALLDINVVDVGDTAILEAVEFEGDRNYRPDNYSTAMTINASNVTLSGAASFPYFNTIRENQGHIRLLNGIRFHTEGDLTNTGSIELDANSDLIVHGDLLLHGGDLTVLPCVEPEGCETGDRLVLASSRDIEVVGARLGLLPGGMSLVGRSPDTRSHSNNMLEGNWRVQESSTTGSDGTVEITPALVTGLAGEWGIEYLQGHVQLDGETAAFPALSNLREIAGKLEITGGNVYQNTAAAAEFEGVPASTLRVSGDLVVEHGGAVTGHTIEAFGNVTLGENGSLSVEEQIVSTSRYASELTVDGVLHAKTLALGVPVVSGKQPKRSLLQGNGRIASDVSIQHGTLVPGDEAGLRIFGDLQLSPETISQFVLDAGDAQSRLFVDSATLSGSLEVLAAASYDPPLNERIELIGLNDESTELEFIEGDFDAVSLATTTTGKAFELSITPEGVFLDPYLLGDFNGDDLRDAIDIDLLSSVGMLLGTEQFDLNDDGQVNQADRVIWVEGYQRTNFGDADLNGTVEFGDFLALSANFGGLGGWRRGDFDGDQRIAFSDFLLLSENFGQATSSLTSVPEPTTLSITMLCLLMFSRRKRTGREIIAC